MKRRLLHLMVALMAFAATTMAQSLSVAPIEATPGTETTITVNIAGAAEMTALQCNLHLPEGLTLTESTGNYGITLGDAANGHTLSVSPLSSGDLLIVLYDLYQSTFTDGTLLTIPIVAAEEPSTTEGTLSKVRTSTIAAQSKALSDVKFTAVVEEEEPEAKYYWYVGQENPVDIDTDNLKAATNEAGWHLIGESIDGFTLTFNNDNLIEFEEKKQYYLVIPEGLDVLAADGVTLHRTLIEIPSNIENHKVYQSKGETYDVNGVVIKSNVTKYYWYVGQEDPTNNSTITSTTGAEGWRLIYQPNSVTKNNPLFDTTDSDEETIVGTKKANWYIAFPADKSYRIFDSDHEDQITAGNFYVYSYVTFNDVEYVVYKGFGTARKWWGYTIYGGEVAQYYYWYAGQEHPSQVSTIVTDKSSTGWRMTGSSLTSHYGFNTTANPIASNPSQNALWYFALPANTGLGMFDAIHNDYAIDENTADKWTEYAGTCTFQGVEYIVYCTGESRSFSAYYVRPKDFVPELTLDGIKYHADAASLTASVEGVEEGFSQVNVEIPANVDYCTVTDVNTHAFSNNTVISSILLPPTVTRIARLAFVRCSNLTSITFLGQTPPEVDAEAFSDFHYEQITLNVPEGAEEAYKQHEVWGKFFKEEEPLPTVASGEYYLYHAESKRFLSRGEHWGTCATVDRYGIPFVWTAEEYSLKFLDSNVHLFETDDSNIYTDNNSTGFAFEAVEGGYLLKSQKSDRYLTIGNAAITHDIVNVTDDASAAVVWQLKSKAEHDAIVAGYVEENYANVIKAAGLTATTGDFADYLSTLTATDMTSAIGTARFAGSAGDWTFTEVRHQDWQPAYGTDFCELWQATGSYTQTLTGLAEGIYKVTVQGFERSGGWATCNTLAEKGYEISTATLSANGEETNLKSWYSGKTDENNPDNTGQAVAKFNEGKYMNEVYTYVGADGTLTLTVCKPSHVGGNWIVFNNFTLTRYAEGGTDTGVGQWTMDNGQWTIYDLQGRKVENTENLKGGIYIVNGRKVVIR